MTTAKARTVDPDPADLRTALTAAEAAEAEALAAQQAAEQARAAANDARQRAEAQRQARQHVWATDVLRDAMQRKAEARQAAYAAQAAFEQAAPVDLQAALAAFNGWMDALHGEALIAREAWIAGGIVNGGREDKRHREPAAVGEVDFIGHWARALHRAALQRAEEAAARAAAKREGIFNGQEG